MIGSVNNILNEIVNEEFERFLCEINESEFEIGCFLDETDYEDEYSHNEIGTMQVALTEKIRNYLHEYHPGKYIVSNSWCVHVMTPEHARKAHVSEYTIKNFLVR